jgi:hypothetical protein
MRQIEAMRGVFVDDLIDPAVVEAVERTATPPDADGWCRAVIPIESIERAMPELLAQGADVAHQLRAHMAVSAAALSRLYRA